MYTLDTNALIYHLHDERSVRGFIDDAIRNALPLYISSISVTELLRFQQLPLGEELAIAELLPALSVVPVDLQIARKAGELGRFYTVKLADSIIAATALFTGTTLITRNVKDFKKIDGLAIQKI